MPTCLIRISSTVRTHAVGLDLLVLGLYRPLVVPVCTDEAQKVIAASNALLNSCEAGAPLLLGGMDASQPPKAHQFMAMWDDKDLKEVVRET
jgi:hypothetical protein